MQTIQIVVLVVVSFLFSFALIVAMGWNIYQAVHFFRARSQDASLKDAPQAAWQLSVIACFTGPLAVILLGVSLVMAVVQWKQLRRVTQQAEAFILLKLALLNSALVLGMAVLLLIWTLWVVATNPLA